MAVDTNKPAETESVKPATSTTVAASAKPSSTKPAARPGAAKAAAPAAAKPARKKAPAPAKAATTAAKKVVTHPPVATKSSPAKQAAHEPKPFIAKDDKEVKPAKVKKAKLVRDSFTMPEKEYTLIATLKKRCLNAGVSAKKSEILRAAVAILAELSDAAVVAAVHRLEVVKTGRPAKGSK